MTQLRFTVTFTVDFGPMMRAVEQLSKAFGQAALAMVRLGEQLTPRSIPHHAFTPNYDLVCTRCTQGPEATHR